MSTQLIQSGGLMQTPDFAQLVYLDFDGESTAYNGEILTVDNVEVQNSNLTQERIQQITAALNEQFASQNVQFVLDRPTSGDYSTIYIGKTSNFEPYGHFAGLAETVDSGNQNKSDNAFVMLDSLSSNEQIVNVIAHETGHLLGTLDHGGSGLQKYAYRYDVSSGVISSGITLDYTASMYVSSGGTADSTTVNSGGNLRVLSGGTATNTMINSSGYLRIFNGGMAQTATMNPHGKLFISSGGAVTDTAVYSSSLLRISGGGAATKTSIYSNGVMYVEGTADNTTVHSGGSLYIFDSGMATNTIVNCGYRNCRVYRDGFVQDTTINDGGDLHVSSGGTATGTTVNSGGYTRIFGSGIAEKNIVNFSGYLEVNNGGTATDITASKASVLLVLSGGTATAINASAGARLWLTVASNTYVQGTYAGSAFEIKDTYISGYTVTKAGYLAVESGGTATAIDATSGALWLSVAPDTYIQGTSAGSAFEMKDACISGYTVDGGGVYVSSGGTATDITVNEGGDLRVLGGGTATAINASSGANLELSVAPDTYIQGISAGSAFEIKDAYVSGYTVDSRGCLYISSGGTATDTIVNSGSYLYVYSNGRISGGLQIASGAVVSAYSGALIDFTVAEQTAPGTALINDWSLIRGGSNASYTITVKADQASGSYILADGAAEFAKTLSVQNTDGATLGTISAGGTLALESGTYSLSLTNGTLSLNYAGTPAPVSDAVKIYSSGTLVRQNSSFTGEVLVHGGNNSMFVTNSGTVDSTTVNSGGLLRVYSGGTAADTTVNSDGYLFVSSGGTAANTTVNSGGWIGVCSGGTATAINASAGAVLGLAVASNTCIQGASAGSAFEMKNAYISGYSIGCLSFLEVNSGGTATHATVNFYGNLYVSSGGTATNTTVNNYGNLYVSSGGTATDTTVNNYGYLRVYSGGRISGPLQIAAGAVVSAYQGAVIDFSVAEQTAPATALINDWSLISGGTYADYTLTVKVNQASGSYILAEGAADFANTITVKDTSDTTLGTLDVGETKEFSGASYTLAKNDGELSLTIVNKVVASAKSDLDGNGISDVMFQYTGGNYQIGFWMNGSSTWQATGASQPSNWELLGNYDMDANGKADQVMFGNVLGGAYIGYYKDGDTTSNGWETIGYLNNPDGIEWRNVVGNLTGNEGKNSIVWQAPELNACGVWTDGTTDWVGITGSFDASWEMLGCGDFTGDGKDEILWQYNGALYTTDIDGNFASLGGWGAGWDVRAIGDFSNDGKDDIVVFHKETGLVIKFADGLAENWSSLGQLDASDWFIVGAGDYNNDRKEDLLVRQYSTGMLGYYSAGDMSQWNEMGRGVDMNWTVIA